MSKQAFFNAADQCGVAIAELAAEMCGVCLAQRQLWALQYLSH